MNNIKCDKCFQSFHCILHDTYGFNYCNDCICKICLEKPCESTIYITQNSQLCIPCSIIRRRKQIKIILLYGKKFNLSHDIEDLILNFLSFPL
jgi:hypothetical protein